ncbi:uncharacterized protein LOC107027727 [Solanum pennellii]|uniref:Uncharacterized protein LOC107027727 n=1 Tax=Solanum pennellii TaxID=28526 RepID=A0ABM1HEA8_SOLPN|nr:uncharacterized protein LOC107027727 [Solanum pennellii]
MPPRRGVRGRTSRRNVEPQEQGVAKAPNVQPQREFINVEFREAIRILGQLVTNQVGKQQGARQKEADISRILEFLRMNPPSFIGFITELKEAKVREFLTLKQDSLSVHEYGLKFTKIPRYALEMVKDMGSMMILFVVVEEEKLRDREEFKNKRAKKGNESGVVQGGSKPPCCAKCGRNHSGVCREGSAAQSSSVALPDRATPRGTTSGTGGDTNHLYALNNFQEQEDLPDVVTERFGFKVNLSTTSYPQTDGQAERTI